MATASAQKHLFMGPVLLYSHFSMVQQDLTVSGKHQAFSRGLKKIPDSFSVCVEGGYMEPVVQ